MRIIVLISSLAAVAFARPDIGLKLREQGYNYQPPATNYGVPNYQQQQTGFATNQFQQSQRIPSGSYIPSAPNSNFQIPQVNYNQNSFAGGIGLSSQGAGQGYQSNSFSSQSGSTLSSNSLSQLSFQQQQQYAQSAEVQKHVYFYEAPYEPEEPKYQKQIPVAPATKNYKIIFIKAPTQAPPTAPTIPLQAQNEEKTLVYVLVKKPDEQPDIHVPEPVPTQPSKPEVFFIKYKTKQEAEDKIQGTLQGGNHQGVIANTVHNGAEFVSSIQDSLTHHHGADGGHGGHTHGISSNFGNGFDASQSSQTGSTISQSQIAGSGSSSSGSLSLAGGNGAGHSKYGPPGPSGPY